MNVAGRIEALRRQMRDEGIPAVVVSTVANLRYLTGFDDVIDDGINGACLVTQDLTRFYTDKRYADAAVSAAEGGPWEIGVQRENLYIEICDDLHDLGAESLALETSVPYGRFKFISEQFRGAVRMTDHLVETFRQVKELSEIERIEAAATIADRAFDHMVEFIRPGLTEAEIALELEFTMRRHGSDGMPFAPIVASGPNGAHPHAIPGPRTITPGDLIVLDFGARVGGYCSDMTRTVCVGAASDEQRRLYDAVLAANEAGLAEVRAGRPCVDVDRVGRDVLVERGLGDLFTHGIGHGVGLDIHEMPTLGPRSTQSLRNHAVVTVEPGVYVEGFAGVRIEDLVVVEDGGHRRLTNSPKELIEI
ncbi:MAG: aminopeptidase P family protein [Coriobacteriia bacterium]|nr:aminopeptidase P family protein [Coriobacteriia bacterium]MBN2840635.1 aminopeptidase P family protein [Coriobacteriia bacterium]